MGGLIGNEHDMLQLVGFVMITPTAVHEMVGGHRRVRVPCLRSFYIRSVLGKVVEDVDGVSQRGNEIFRVHPLATQWCGLVGEIAVVTCAATADGVSVVFEEYEVASGKRIVEVGSVDCASRFEGACEGFAERLVGSGDDAANGGADAVVATVVMVER